MATPTNDEVTIDVSAPPERVYGLISDITRMGEWSPECRRCEWIDGATGPDPVQEALSVETGCICRPPECCFLYGLRLANRVRPT